LENAQPYHLRGGWLKVAGENGGLRQQDSFRCATTFNTAEQKNLIQVSLAIFLLLMFTQYDPQPLLFKKSLTH
jgi:hypothetical protein